MTAKELLKKLYEHNVISLCEEWLNDERCDCIYVEDPASYAGSAKIYFDKNDNVIKVETE